MLKPDQPRDQAEHDDHEQRPTSDRTCAISSSRMQRATPYLPIVNAIAPNAPIGASFMMMRDDAEQDVRDVVDEVRTSRCAASPQRHQREAEQQREQQDLQDFALGEGATNVSGMMCRRKSTVVCAVRLRGVRSDRSGVERGRIDEARARLAARARRSGRARARKSRRLRSTGAPCRRRGRPSSCPPCRRCRSPPCRR